MVETTRGGGFSGAGMATGCSSRDTSFSRKSAVFASTWSDVLALELLMAGTILFGPSWA